MASKLDISILAQIWKKEMEREIIHIIYVNLITFVIFSLNKVNNYYWNTCIYFSGTACTLLLLICSMDLVLPRV